jgi:mannan endo-1,4-beta-mannosidase
MDFIKVNGTRFFHGNQPYFIKGANYWQGMNLAAQTEYGGNRTRVCIELDQLKQMDVNNLRVMAASEGPDDQPFRMRPSLQPAPGQYNEFMFEALDFLLDEMSKREITAVSK